MKSITLVLFFAASAAAGGSSASFRMESSPQLLSLQRDTIPIVRFAQDIRAGSDSVSFEAGNGIVLKDETQVVEGRGGSYEDGNGRLIQTDKSVLKTGSYSYKSPEGLPITVHWEADEQGFRATGDHLPVPPAQEALPVRAAAAPARVFVSHQ